jgi:hypothetical protein
MPSEIKGSSNFDSDSAGKVLQVVGNSTTSQSSTSSTSWADVPNFSQSITLSSTSSRVMVLIDGTFGHRESKQQFNIALYRDGTKIHSSDLIKSFGGAGYTSGNGEPSGIMVIDNPATTSTITYKLKWQALQGQPMYFNRGDNSAQDFTSSITLMEIGA